MTVLPVGTSAGDVGADQPKRAEDWLWSALVGIVILAGLFVSYIYNFALFHSLIEIATISVACALFFLIWNTRKYLEGGYLRLIGLGYGFVALIDLAHTLAYRGENVFPGYDADNLTVQLWTAARYLQAVTLFLAPFLVNRNPSNKIMAAGYFAAAAALLAAIFSGHFPDCYITGEGLTPFKIASEYIISATLCAALYLLFRIRQHFDRSVYHLIGASIIFTIMSELLFTLHVHFYDLSSIIGHYFKLAAFYLMYRAILVTGVENPFAIIFRDLKQTEEALRESRDSLEEKVAQRTATLQRLNRELRAITDCGQALIHAVDEQKLLNEVCRIVCEEAGHRMAWVGYAENDEAKTIRPVAWAGVEEGYLEQARLTWADTERGRGPGGIAVRSGKTAFIQDFAIDPQATPWRDNALQRGYRSCIVLPLKDETAHPFGFLAIYSTEPNVFIEEEIRLLEELAGDLAFGVMTLRARIARDRAQEETDRLNKELEQRVEKRTAELNVALDAAEAANKAKSVFLATMSHELRTPLNSILGFSNLMRREPDISPSQQERLDIINRSGEHLLSLINDILDITKIESGKLLLEETPTDLHQQIQDVRSMMHARAKEKGLTFAVEQSPDVPRCVNVDASKLRQILVNLTANAVKFTDAGGVILRIAVVMREPNGPARLRFEVQDSGPGIKAEDMDRIFHPFEQLIRVPSAGAGSGLGLTICKQYVKLMGGEIGVTSEVGKGSVFSFEIPVAVLPEDAIPAVPRRGHVVGVEGEPPRHRILIVEDEAENRLLLSKLLEPWGFELREAANGKEGLEIFEQWHPGLIWMDIRMPVMDGREATRRIRLAEGGAQTKIIALTAHALEEERAEIMEAGCDGFVRKPYREQEIFEAITQHLGVRFLYAGEAAPPSGGETPELTADRLYGLPSEITDELLKAAELLDGPLVLEVIGRIGEKDKELGEVLRRMAESLKYKELLTVLDTVAEKRAA